MKKILFAIISIIIPVFIIVSCGQNELSKLTLNNSTETKAAYLGNIDPEDIGISPIVWNGETDRAFAVNVEAVQNTTRKNASGIKITSNARSDNFPGIYFIWDSKQKDNGYLKVSAGIFTVLESFVLTSKEANTYWDFLISPQLGQQETDDNCFVFFIPKANNNKNINMVYIEEWTAKGQAEDPVDPEDPVVLPSDDITVSVSIDYELNSWDGDILVRLTLEEGEWDNFIAKTTDERALLSQWITLSYAGDLYNQVTCEVGGGYDYINSSRDIYNINPSVLFFRFRHGYPHITMVIGKEQIVNNFLMHFPFTVTLNEEKLDEMKAKTDITDNLTTGIKSATLDKLKEEDIIEADLLEKYNLTMGTGIWNDYMPMIVYPLRSIFTIHFDSEVELPPMEVFATVITERITLPVSLYDIYDGKGAYGNLFRKDFRPVDHFRINDGEEYTLEIIIRIKGEQQTITTEKNKVFVTH